MQRPCLLVATRELGLLIKEKYTTTTLFDETCLGPVGHQDSSPKFATVAVDKIYNHTIVWMGSRQCRAFFIPLMSSKILLIFLHLILRLSFLTDQQ